MPHLTAYTPKVFLRPSGIKDPAKILGKGCGGSLKITMYSRIFSWVETHSVGRRRASPPGTKCRRSCMHGKEHK